MRRQPREIGAVEQDAPLIRRLEPRDQPQQGGLAGAGAAEQRQELARFDPQTQPVQRKGRAEAFGDALDRKQGQRPPALKRDQSRVRARSAACGSVPGTKARASASGGGKTFGSSRTAAATMGREAGMALA